jgi:dCTP diphosphatase
MKSSNLTELKHRLRQFADERDWDQFHSPKNLSMALIAEAAELVEHFQWLTEEESSQLNGDKLEEVRQELADIQIYLVRIADKLNVDLLEAVEEKIKINEEKYPADKVKGQHKKYTEYVD